MAQTTADPFIVTIAAYADTAIVEPSLTVRVEQVAAMIAARPRNEHVAWLGILLAELRKHGVDVELMECALEEMG